MVSVVVIGRNEGKRLVNCLQSVHHVLSDFEHELIYVDSHSSDDSIMRAKDEGARCYMPRSKATTAALGRDIGMREAKGQYILFLDGDMTLEAGFTQSAIDTIVRSSCAGVCGIRKDIYYRDGVQTGENANYYQCDQIRVAPEFGGAVLLKRDALLACGGWACDVETCEEAELHARLQMHGLTVIEIPQPMIVHHDCVQGNRSSIGIVLSRRRLGHGQALRHAIEAGSVRSLFVREKRMFSLWMLDVLCVMLCVFLGLLGVMISIFIQAIQIGYLLYMKRIRTFVSAKLLFVYLPLGMLSYKKRDKRYSEMAV